MFKLRIAIPVIIRGISVYQVGRNMQHACQISNYPFKFIHTAYDWQFLLFFLSLKYELVVERRYLFLFKVTLALLSLIMGWVKQTNQFHTQSNAQFLYEEAISANDRLDIFLFTIYLFVMSIFEWRMHLMMT